jgi:hypothetical protein
MTNGFTGADPIKIDGGEGQPKLRELLEFVRTAYEQGQLTFTKSAADEGDASAATITMTAPLSAGDGERRSILAEASKDLRV